MCCTELTDFLKMWMFLRTKLAAEPSLAEGQFLQESKNME
jgi:hypothetical protein